MLIKLDNNIMLASFFRKFSDLKMRLTPHEFYVTQGKGIERPFTGDFWWYKEVGTYYCKVCNHSLFPSHYKFHPTTGICAFFASFKDATKVDNGEISCNHCNSHLGKVLDDGPAPTHIHLQVMSASLKFKPMPFFELPPVRNELKKARLHERLELQEKKLAKKKKREEKKKLEAEKKTGESKKHEKKGNV